MMLRNHTTYIPYKMNALLSRHQQLLGGTHLPITSYKDLLENVPICTADRFQEIIDGITLKNCTYSMSSGTSGKPKMLANSLLRSENKQNYARYFKTIVEKYILNKDDVVMNLFTAGGISTLYENCNSLLEGIGCSILPVGRIDSFSNSQQCIILKQAERFNASVLIGTPSSIIQVLRLSQKFNIRFNIKKIVFTGEFFALKKQEYINKFWPEAKFFGLYGHTETGFVAFNTPSCDYNHYHVLEDWFFVETSSQDDVLITSFADPIIPVIRYQVGDKGKIASACGCGINSSILVLEGRSDKSFNYAGNLISTRTVHEKISSVLSDDFEIQFQLSCDSQGNDILTIVLSLDEDQLKIVEPLVKEKILEIDEIKECLEKEAGKILFLSSQKMLLSDRQKYPLIIDSRNDMTDSNNLELIDWVDLVSEQLFVKGKNLTLLIEDFDYIQAVYHVFTGIKCSNSTREKLDNTLCELMRFVVGNKEYLTQIIACLSLQSNCENYLIAAVSLYNGSIPEILQLRLEEIFGENQIDYTELANGLLIFSLIPIALSIYLHNDIDKIDNIMQSENNFLTIVGSLLSMGSYLLPTELLIFNKLLVALHAGFGIVTPTIILPRFSASTQASMQTNLIAGMTGSGPAHVGASKTFMELLEKYMDMSEEDIALDIDSCMINKTKIPGFGHPLLNRDPRNQSLEEFASLYLPDSKYINLYRYLSKIMNQRYNLSPNIDAITASILLELGINSQTASMLFIFARIPSMIAHIIEKKSRPAFGFKKIEARERFKRFPVEWI